MSRLQAASSDFTPEPDTDPRMCPVSLTLRLVAHRWTVQIIHLLYAAPSMTLRFKQLHRALPPITQKELTKRLRQLEAVGLLERTVFAEVPPRVEYTLTKQGQTLMPALEPVAAWARAHGAEVGPKIRAMMTAGELA